jgi:POT family proton-dependent oligopeptide transporter
MLISVLVQKVYQDKYIRNPQGVALGEPSADAPKQWQNPLLIVAGLLAFAAVAIGLLYVDATQFSFLTYLLLGAVLFIAFVLFSDKSLSKPEKQRVGVIFVVAFFVIFFWSAFEQAGASLTLFTDRQTDRSLNWNISTYVIYAILSLLIVYFVKLWRNAVKNLSRNDKSLLTGVQIVLAIIIAGIAYVIYSLASKGEASILLNEIPASTFQSLNSFFVVIFAPVFAWLWIKLGRHEPSAPTKMAIGLFLLAVGYLWIAFGVKDVSATTRVSMMWIIGMYALHTWGELCLSPIGLSLVNKLAPLKFASLLMAVWFLANAAANKLAGVLSALYPSGERETSFLGYTMQDNYDFFMLFVFMAGTASLILFLISKKLQTMMNAGK